MSENLNVINESTTIIDEKHVEAYYEGGIPEDNDILDYITLHLKGVVVG